MKVLLSIKPQFAEKIFNGTKRYEYRRKIFKNSNVKSIIVYVTQPIGRILGKFDISGIEMDTPEAIWSKTNKFSGISEEHFQQYFFGRETAFALKIGNVRKYELPLDPKKIFTNFTPPQSYMYILKDF